MCEATSPSLTKQLLFQKVTEFIKCYRGFKDQNMPIIAPFRGLIYDFSVIKDLSTVVAPPYDVISEDEQAAYYRADPHNVTRLILGKKKRGDSDWDNRYTRAADCLKRWESAGILIRSYQPCVYITSLTYKPGNGAEQRTRWGIIVLVRIEDEGSGVILPHEKTFSAHRDDRLKLMRACNAQLSQIFGLYEDPENTIVNACKTTIDLPAQIAFEFGDGTKHEMWILQTPSLFKKVAGIMLEKPIFIADGHHRYETARNFRNIMRARYGLRPANRSYEYVMMYLSNMDDEGLTILPSHRLIKRAPGFQLQPFLEKIEKKFEITKFPLSSHDPSSQYLVLKQKLEEAGRSNTAILFINRDASGYHLFSLKPGEREKMGNDLHPSLKKLDVLVLSRFILQEGLGFSRGDLDNEELFHYDSSMRATVSQVQSGNYQMAFLLNPTKIGQVKEIASHFLVMPRKSTYFYPKVITGLVFNKIEPHEIIQVP